MLLILSRAYGLDRDLGGKGASPDGEVWKNLEAVLSGLPDNLVRYALVVCHSANVIFSSMRRDWRWIQTRHPTSKNWK